MNYKTVKIRVTQSHVKYAKHCKLFKQSEAINTKQNCMWYSHVKTEIWARNTEMQN